MVRASFLSLPFLLAGGLKTVYDVLLYRGFRAITPPKNGPKNNPKNKRRKPCGPERLLSVTDLYRPLSVFSAETR